MSAHTMQRTPRRNQIIPRRSFGTSAYVRRARDRRNAARVNKRVLKGISADAAAPYMAAQELSAARNEEDGGCLGRLLNMLRVIGDRRKEIADFIQSEVRLMDARMPADALREAFNALDAEEIADAADCTPQQEFNRNPNAETSRVLRESLETHRAGLDKAIDALKQFEEQEESK